jgi:DNA-binding NarL/FixJ family response regulator
LPDGAADEQGDMRDLIRVLVVDDHEMLADALGLLFSRHPVFELVGCASDAQQAVELTTREEPDVVLMDLELPGIDALQTVSQIKAARRSTRVVGVSSGNDPVAAWDLVAVGGSGCVDKSRAVEEVLDLVRRAAAGEVVLPDVGPPDGVEGTQGVAVGRRADAGVALGRLTAREAEILRALAGGDSIAGVAEQLGISPLTVENHVKSILAKLGVHSKIEAVMLAWRHGVGREAQGASGPRTTRTG